MNECESFEILISTHQDDELEVERLPELLEHLALCRSCRRFYLEGRALAGVLEAIPEMASTQEPPERHWPSILDSAGAGAGRRAWAPSWALKLAASLLLVLGLTFLWLRIQGPGEIVPEPTEIALGETPGAMSDERFVEIIKQLLQGDRRYRLTMLQVMAEVEGGGEEGSGDGLARVEEGAEDAGEEAGRLRV